MDESSSILTIRHWIGDLPEWDRLDHFQRAIEEMKKIPSGTYRLIRERSCFSAGHDGSDHFESERRDIHFLVGALDEARKASPFFGAWLAVRINLKIQNYNSIIQNLSSQEESKPVIKRTNIYMMRDETNGFIKIGESNDPKYRESTLQSEKPTIDLIWSIEGTVEDEAKLHEAFKEERVRGEWFRLTEHQTDFIKSEKWRNQ